MSQAFPYSEQPEEPESERPSEPETGQPYEPQEEEAAQTQFTGSPSDADTWAPLPSEPEESAAETIPSGEPLESASEPFSEPARSEEEQSFFSQEAYSAPSAEEVPPEGAAQTGEAETGASEPVGGETPPPTIEESLPPPGATPPHGVTPQPLSSEEERTWSMISHLTMLLNLVTGFLGPVAALVIYLAYKDRSKYVAFHAMQSFIFQLVTWIGGGLLIGAIWIVTGLLSAMIIGLLCIPFAALLTIPLAALPIVGIVYSIVAAIQVNSGQPFSYWLVGDWTRGMLD